MAMYEPERLEEEPDGLPLLRTQEVKTCMSWQALDADASDECSDGIDLLLKQGDGGELSLRRRVGSALRCFGCAD